MTDRLNAFIVILTDDIREDDAEATINAIKQIRGVLDVQPHVSTFSDEIAESRVRHELGVKLWNILYPKGITEK